MQNIYLWYIIAGYIYVWHINAEYICVVYYCRIYICGILVQNIYVWYISAEYISAAICVDPAAQLTSLSDKVCQLSKVSLERRAGGNHLSWNLIRPEIKSSGLYVSVHKVHIHKS